MKSYSDPTSDMEALGCLSRLAPTDLRYVRASTTQADLAWITLSEV
jgi:hypothetical protein